MTYDDHKKALAKLIGEASHRHRKWKVFSDFVEMAAISIANACLSDREREQRYMQIIKAYNPDEMTLFPKMLGHVTMALECEYGDVLGETYMMLELGNDDRGQFFTPYDVCLLMAQTHDIAIQAERDDIVTVSDPAVGAGALLIAFAQEAKRQGLNFQKQVHATGTDVDISAVHMAYIQLSLIGLPAVLIHGNSLTLEEHSRWYTPMHMMGNWGTRLRNRDHIRGAVQVIKQIPDPEPVTAPNPAGQMELFT